MRFARAHDDASPTSQRWQTGSAWGNWFDGISPQQQDDVGSLSMSFNMMRRSLQTP